MTAPARTQPAVDDWHLDLAEVLGPWAFPSRRDDLVALLLRHHAPSHLLWHLSVLPPNREFASLDDLVTAASDTTHGSFPVAEPL